MVLHRTGPEAWSCLQERPSLHAGTKEWSKPVFPVLSGMHVLFLRGLRRDRGGGGGP